MHSCSAMCACHMSLHDCLPDCPAQFTAHCSDHAGLLAQHSASHGFSHCLGCAAASTLSTEVTVPLHHHTILEHLQHAANSSMCLATSLTTKLPAEQSAWLRTCIMLMQQVPFSCKEVQPPRLIAQHDIQRPSRQLAPVRHHMAAPDAAVRCNRTEEGEVLGPQLRLPSNEALCVVCAWHKASRCRATDATDTPNVCEPMRLTIRCHE